MSDGAQQITAGWYPDPAGSGGQRWWDGAGWTQHVTPPPAPAAVQPLAQYAAQAPAYRAEALGADPQVPESTPTATVWVWLLVFVPLVSLVPLFFWDVTGFLQRSIEDPYTASYAIFLDPWYLVMMGLSWIVYGVVVWFAYLDYAALGRLGYARRFHWAWTFLSALVYVIGRTVFVRRQAGGRGMGPLWAYIAVTVATVILTIAWTAWLMARIFEFASTAVTAY